MIGQGSIQNNIVHLWHADLSAAMLDEDMLACLSADELTRRDRLKFAIHQRRFAFSRAILRHILSFYTNTPAVDIHFEYGKRGKPFLKNSNIHFNVSHSEDLFVCALISSADIGVDVEKIQPDYKDDVAKRFFSHQEYQALQLLPQAEKISAFYRIWAKKESVIKVLGEGLFAPLDSFSVSAFANDDVITLVHENQAHQYWLYDLNIHPDYQAALAVSSSISQIEYKDWCTLKP